MRKLLPALALLTLATSATPLTASPMAAAQPSELAIPAENDWRDPPARRPPVGDAAQRAEQLFTAILQDDPSLARDFFFPLEPFLVVKGIADPRRYWEVLLRHYERDIHALHGEIPAGATFDRLVMTRRGGWVDRREEANAVPYWASRHDWIYYRVDGAERRFELRTLINWGPRWYITHIR